MGLVVSFNTRSVSARGEKSDTHLDSSLVVSRVPVLTCVIFLPLPEMELTLLCSVVRILLTTQTGLSRLLVVQFILKIYKSNKFIEEINTANIVVRQPRNLHLLHE
jgi:hypothetical protein